MSLPDSLFDPLHPVEVLSRAGAVTEGHIAVEVVLTNDPGQFPGFTPVSFAYRVDSDFGSFGVLPVGQYVVDTEVKVLDAATGTYVGICAPTQDHFAVSATPGPVATGAVIEFYNAQLDHYFITQSPAEIDDLDRGRHAGWARTGQSFVAYLAKASDDRGRATCRWYGLPSAGLDSHFISASRVECDAIAVDPMTKSSWQLEANNVLEIPLPNTLTGVCPPSTQPVYRLWNNRIDSNHRYTTDRMTRDRMVSEGYVSEGFGPDGVAMCAIMR